MLRTRIIPCLLLKGQTLVKTRKFKNPNYIGDPVNTVRIFNELEVDELSILDIEASSVKSQPNFELLQTITNECFMPLSYGGGITNIQQAERLFSMGFEKIILNSALFSNPNLVTQIAEHYGSQAVIASIDVKRDWLGREKIFSHGGKKKTEKDLIEWAVELEKLGAGEILLTNIDNEGCWTGFDIELYKRVADSVGVPVIANGGANSINSIGSVVKKANVSAVALGSMVVYQAEGMGVLVNFPDRAALEAVLK